MIGENTEDLGEVWVNLVCRLCLGENISKLVFARDPMELVRSILLPLSYQVETTFDVAGFAGQFAVLGNLNCGIIANHKDSRCSRKTLDRLLPLFGAQECHIIKEHSDVSCGHGCRACSHVFSFRGGRGNGCRHGGVCLNEGTIVKDHVSNSRTTSIWAILPAGFRKDNEVRIGNVVVAVDIVYWI